ncbi:MAG: efflux RND transporter permease subunit [Proteobacteria bacterium]|nr:efflux RND transporter permease subunit [Pseudomonadota bacterium]
MRLSQVCIDRPVLSWVMSLMIVLFGLIGLLRLPNREMPDVDPPIVSVTTVYPGAAPEVVEISVTQILEDAVNGIEGVKHVTSQSREQVSQLSIEFGLTRDIEAAANDVRDRVARVRNRLPDEVDEPVVAKRDSDAWAVMWLALYGADYDQISLTTIAEKRIKDRIAKLPGVASVMVGGERRYSMRVWLQNRRLGAHGLTIADVVNALRRENVDIPSGRLESLDTEFTVRSLGELRTVADYEALIVATVGGKAVRLRDVATVEVGPETDRKITRFNGKPNIGLGVVKQSKANTLDVANAVRAEVVQIQSELESGLKLEVAFDSSVFIQESIQDVTLTIFIAVILVVLVNYVFLRSARATIVPAIAIPVSIIGSLGFLYFLGFSINTLTLMGITLAIGLVVDDAIVVLENITRWIEAGAPPVEAARRGMEEISFAVVASTVAAVAVFVPLAFLTDTTGRLFREFAVTVAAALAISGFVALTLSPMICARVLRKAESEHGLKGVLARFFERLADSYARLLRPVVTRPGLTAGVAAFGVLWFAAGVFLYGQAREELVPESDRGVLIIWTEAPEGSTVQYMDRYQRQAEKILMDDPDVPRAFSVVALGIGTPGIVNQGVFFAQLAPRGERDRSYKEIISDLRPKLEGVAGIKAFPLNPSPLRGFRSAAVEIVIQGPDVNELARIADEVERRAEEAGGFRYIRSNLVVNKPQLEVEIDRERASDVGVSVRDVATTLQIMLGGVDVSTFKLDGETYKVIAQLPREKRANPRSLLELFVRGDDSLIPLASLVTSRQTIVPRSIPHFDRFRAVTITADVDGISQGDGLHQMRRIAEEEIPAAGGYSVRFSGEAEKFFESGNALIFAYLLAILVVYLVLAAQFESFVHPATILVAVFLSFTGALIALEVMDQTLNLFSKIGIVMLVGLVTKNSILIVEFSNQLRERGLDLVDAAFTAARTRFRPILMTALATIMGIMPIAAGLGAGGESRAPLGIAVVGGMLFSSILTFFIVPATYVGFERLRMAVRGGEGLADEKPAPAVAGGK